MGKHVGGFGIEHFGGAEMNYHPQDNIGMNAHFNGGEVPMSPGAQRIDAPHMGTGPAVEVQGQGMGINGMTSEYAGYGVNPNVAPRRREIYNSAKDEARHKFWRENPGKPIPPGYLDPTIRVTKDTYTTRDNGTIPAGMSTDTPAERLGYAGVGPAVAAHGSTEDIRAYEGATGNTLAVSPELRSAVDESKPNMAPNRRSGR